MFLFQLTDRETISKEYKEFSFKVDLEKYYEIEEINQVVKTGVLDQRFNTVVMDNIRHYIKYYIPKYISAFCNGHLETFSQLYFGIDDYGEISGIPFIGSLSEKIIKKSIYKSILENTITTDLTKKYIIENLKVSLIPLKVNSTVIYSDLEERLIRVENNYKVAKESYEAYRGIYLKWYSELSNYSVKLVKFYKIHRESLMNFILSTEPEYINVMEQEITPEMMSQIEKLKCDPQNVLYWVCKYRDLKIEETLKLRPKKPHGKPKKLNFSNEFIKLHRLRKKFLEKNPELRYYLLEIEIPNQCTDEVFYKDVYGAIKKKKRVLEKDQPICIGT